MLRGSFALLFLTTAAFAADPPLKAILPTISETEIARLVGNLGDPDFRTRETAADKLRPLGQEVIPALQASLASGNVEANRRAELLLSQIRTRLANEAILAPSMVAIQQEKKPLREALLEFRKQTQFDIRISGDSTILGSDFTFDTGGKVTLWVALEKLMDAAKLEVDNVQPPTNPVSLPPRNVPRPTQSGEERILRDFREKKIVELEGLLKDFAKKRLEIQATLEKTNQKVEKLTLLGKLGELDALIAQTEKQLRATREILNEPTNLPTPNGTIVLRARGTGARPSANVGAVRVEAMPVTPVLTNATPKGKIPLPLVIFPEPGMKWVGVASATTTKAIDQSGRELKFDHEVPDYAGSLTDDEQIMINNLIQRDRIKVQQGAVQTQRIVTPMLHADQAGATTKLTHVEGLIRGNVWSAAEPLLTVKGFKLGETPVIATGSHSMFLSASIVTNPDDKKTQYLEVTLHYSQQAVIPNGRGGASTEEVWLGQQGNGQLRVIPNQRGGPRRKESTTNPQGLQLTDSEGKPFLLGLRSSTVQTSTEDGFSTTFEGKFLYTFRPESSEGTGAPAVLSFQGAQLKEVIVPFTLKDVPVLEGTGSAIPVAPEVLKYKR